MADLAKIVLIPLDYDKTVDEIYQQEPLFEDFADRVKLVHPTYQTIGGWMIVDGERMPVWGEPKPTLSHLDYFKVMANQWKAPRGMAWMQQLLWDCESVFEGKLTRKLFKEVGQRQVMSPGIPDGLWDLKKRWAKEGVDVHYVIISVGLKEIIAASSINDVRDGLRLIDCIFAGEFCYDSAGKVCGLAHCPSAFDKTRGLIEIVKGSSDLLDTFVPYSNYKFDYRNIMVIGDGFTDISYFSYVREKGGVAIAVYKLNDIVEFKKAMLDVGERVDCIFPRDYRSESRTMYELDRIIARIVSRTCDFDQLLLHQYRRERIKDELTRRHVMAHLDACDECEGAYSVRLIPPA